MEKLLNEIEKTIFELRQGQDDGLNLYKKNMPAVLDAISELMDIAENTEFEIPVNVLVQQLKNLEESYTKSDTVILADTLEYEIKNSVMFLIDIKKEMESV